MLLTLKKNKFHYYFKQHPLYHSYYLFLKYCNELSPNTNPHPHTLPSSLLYYSSNEMEKKRDRFVFTSCEGFQFCVTVLR